MTVATERRRLRAQKAVEDIMLGDLVRQRFHRGVGLVDSNPDHGFVWVAWKDGRRDYLPLPVLRKIAPGGSDYDRRRKP